MGDFLEIDGMEEAELPAHLRDGRTGDRVAFVDGGLLHVRNGRATFARSNDVLGVLEHEGSAYVLVPRKPPSQPWIEVTGSMAHGGITGFVQRLEDRGSATGGYRDAVRRRRQHLSPDALRERIIARADVPGALEVPSTVMLGVSYPGLALVQGATVLGSCAVGYFAAVAFAFSSGMSRPAGGDGMLGLMIYPIFIGAGILGAWIAMTIGRRWRQRVNRTLPRQRVLVLAPDGCVVGLSSGIRTLAWSDVGRFEIGPSSHGNGLVVIDANDRFLGDVDAGWLDAPLRLVVDVAEAYRLAARD